MATSGANTSNNLTVGASSFLVTIVFILDINFPPACAKTYPSSGILSYGLVITICMLESLYLLIGQIVVYLFLMAVVTTIFIAIFVIHSFRTGSFPFPNVVLSGILVLEGSIKALFRLFKVDDSIVDDVVIRLRNKVSLKRFEGLPFEKKAIFLPQCLRSVDCPAKLSPEGIQCINCGRCNIGDAKKKLESVGYRVFVVPGSSFIKRMVVKYKPEAILGVGCISEVKDGLDLCHRFGVPAVAIPLETDGCISTALDWDVFYHTTKADKNSSESSH
ncbi:DUF116 domain-containing protein [Halobacteriota archaeon]